MDSSLIQFVIPLTPEGLFKSDSETRYCVTQDDISSLSEKELHKQLDITYSKIDGSALRITECDQFDLLFNCLHGFSSVSTACKSSIIVILENGLKGMINKINNLLSKEPDEYRKSAPKYRNALKMYVYLLRWFVSEEEKKAQERATARGKKKQSAGESKWSSDKQKESTISVLVNILDTDLQKLWNNNIPEDDFLNLFTKLAIDILSVAANTKSKPVRRCITSMLAVLSQRYKQTQNISSVMMEALYKHDHVVGPITDLLEQMINNYDNNEIVGDFMREVGKMDTGNNRGDSGGAKNIASFIVSVSELMPSSILPYISLIIPHLANDSYILRNGIIQALGHIICKGFSNTDERTEDINHRDQFLEILEERFMDTTSYTRSKVIQTWIYLVKEKVVPLKILPNITDAALGRLEDKATQVRKYAIQLLTNLLEFNPFASDLKLSVFTKKLEEAQAELKEKIENKPASQNVGEEEEEEIEKTEEEKKLEKVIAFYEDGVQFISRIHRGIPIVSKLLGSKVNADVLESIHFFVKANEFKIENASEGIKDMLVLIWSKEVATKEAVIEAYQKLYITPPSNITELGQPRLEDIYIANNFVKLVLSATTTEITSLEELVSLFVTKKLISQSTIQCLWDFFAMRVPSVTPRQSKGALIILSMAANSDPEIVRSKISTLVSTGLGSRWKEDEDIARYSCIALQKLTRKSKLDTGKETPTRFDPNHTLFERLRSVIVEDSQSTSKWFPAAEQAINAIYCLAEQPDSLCTPIIKYLASRLLSGEKSPETSENTGKTNNIVLSKFLFVIGHVALKHMQYLEDIQNELTRRKNLTNKPKTPGAPPGDESLEDELGINASVDDTDEYIQAITQNEIVLKNLLGSFAPLIIAVCSNENGQFNDHMVRSAAVLALCKYMCVSSDFCEAHLRLIFTLLERAPESWIRSDVIIALGDLASRFPNQVDAWTPKLYARLRDSDAGVRKNTLMVLSHLILNEMVRVKGQISEIALCIEDDNEQISDLAKLFFNELNNKGNCLYSIYNILPDMVSNLSVKEVPSDTFRSIMKYLFAFIEKERETETLIERLCQKRIRNCSDPEQLADIAYCLSLLNFHERAVKKLIENFNCYKPALVHDTVYSYFMSIIQKAKKLCKTDNKNEIEELEAKIQAQHGGEEEDDDEEKEEGKENDDDPMEEDGEVVKKRVKSAPKRKSAAKTRTPRKSPRASKTRQRKQVQLELSDEESDESMELDDDSE